MSEKECDFTREKFTEEDYKRLVENTKVRCAELRLLDDDFDIEKYTIEACEKALESLSNEMMKTRIKTKPQVFVVSTAWNKNDFLSEFTKMRPLLTKHEGGTIIYLGTYYKPLKRRVRHDRRRKTNNIESISRKL